MTPVIKSTATLPQAGLMAGHPYARPLHSSSRGDPNMRPIGLSKPKRPAQRKGLPHPAPTSRYRNTAPRLVSHQHGPVCHTATYAYHYTREGRSYHAGRRHQWHTALWQKKCWINRENPCSPGCTGRYLLNEPGRQNMCWTVWAFHALFRVAWLADGDSLMCCIVMMGRQIAKMFSTFSLWGSLFLMLTIKVFHCTRNVFLVMHLTLLFINWNQLFKLTCKLPVQALNGFPLSIHRGKGK